MKNIVEKINESLYTLGTGFDACDYLTREYNNLFANISGTLLRKVDVIVDRPVYVLTGSTLRFRPGRDFLYNKDLAVTTLEGSMTPSEFLNDRGYCIYDIDGSNCCANSCVNTNSTETTEDFLDPIIVSAVADMIDDEDYLIIA